MRTFFRISILIFVVLTVSPFCHGQQKMIFTQYMFNGLSINPAYAGSDKYLNATVQSRQQWVGMKGAPNSQTISAHQLIKKQKVGIGLQIDRQQIAVSQLYNVYASYAYKIRSKKSVLSMGIQAGISGYFQQLTQLNTPDDISDPSFSENVSYVQPNIGAGIYYQDKHCYVGVSAPYLIRNIIKYNYSATLDKDASHYFITAGYLFVLGESLKLKPNFLIKLVSGAPVNVDLNSNLLIKDVFWIGCSYRVGNSINPLIEIQLHPKLRLGFSYDVPLNKLYRAGYGSPEIMLNYRHIKKMPNKYMTPRYF